MGKPIHKYNTETGNFICTYKSICQAANDLGLDESTIRKRVNLHDMCNFKGYVLSLRRCDNIVNSEGEEVFTEDWITNKGAKILLIDIETAPTVAGVWRFWKENVNYDQIFDDSYILSFAFKWLLDENVYSAVLTPREAILNDDSRLLESLWHLLDSADIIIAHNGKFFDIPKINTRFIKNGMVPPSSYLIIDTLESVRRMFSFPSNKLGNIAKYLGLTEKVENEGFSLWKKCIHGDEEALEKMSEYNQGDVITLEDLYMTIRPYIKPHPNMGLFVEGTVSVCPTCGSSDIESNGFYYTPMNKYSEFRCGNCGATGRSRYAEKKAKHVLASTSH